MDARSLDVVPEGRAGTFSPDQRTRASRITVESSVLLSPESALITATACDVSESGLKIEIDRSLPSGPVSIKLPGLPIFTGEVRWRHEGRAGLRFLQPISWECLTTWAKIHGLGSPPTKAEKPRRA